MKAFAIFPSICFFILALAIFKAFNFPTRKIYRQLLATVLTLVFSITMFIYSIEMFTFLYFGGFISVIIVILSMTYLLESKIPKKRTKRYWILLSILFLTITIITTLAFILAFLYSMLNNPTDSGLR
jgi:hypothetical protein